MVQSCVSGVGIAQVLSLSVAQQIADGMLVELFPEWPDETIHSISPALHVGFLPPQSKPLWNLRQHLQLLLKPAGRPPAGRCAYESKFHLKPGNRERQGKNP